MQTVKLQAPCVCAQYITCSVSCTFEPKRKKRIPSDRCAQWRHKSACASAHTDQSSLSSWRNFASLAIQKVSSEILIRLRKIFAWRTCPNIFWRCGSFSAVAHWRLNHQLKKISGIIFRRQIELNVKSYFLYKKGQYIFKSCLFLTCLRKFKLRPFSWCVCGGEGVGVRGSGRARGGGGMNTNVSNSSIGSEV